MQNSFDTLDALSQVAEFHEIFGAPVLDTPQLISDERAKLRLSLLEEELNELRTAIADQNLTEIADALCDLQYVLSGAVLEFGLGKKFKTLFDEVQRSNMSKASATLQDAERTREKYMNDGVPCSISERDGKYIVLRDADHKVLKSVAYSPANLTAILDQDEN